MPLHEPSLRRTSPWVHGSPSSHATPGFGLTVQVDPPLQLRSARSSLVQTISVPPQVPSSLHVSSKLHSLPSSQRLPARGVTLHVAVPLHTRVLQASLTQETLVPVRQVPLPSQVSPNVQGFPSLHAPPAPLGVTRHPPAPSQTRVLQASS